MKIIRWRKPAVWAAMLATGCGLLAGQQNAPQRSTRFLHQRGLGRQSESPAALLARARLQHAADSSATSLGGSWASIGPGSVNTARFGAISGRITAIAADPSNSNNVYVGTTGGGVWESTNAASATPTFTSLTDTLPAAPGCPTPPLSSLSIGALTVQPGNTGVILAGTGDPNDALDSYYGEGILRSTDHGATWCLIPNSMDAYNGALRGFSFRGLGFAGFAWNTARPQFVVAAVAQSAEGVAVNAPGASSVAGIYYSPDSGQTWLLAKIEDDTSGNTVVQSSQNVSTSDPGNSATSVTWNPVRNRFYAAVRYHGYYESTDDTGSTWVRLAHQPGANLSPGQCPAFPGSVGLPACPIFRGTIVSQPDTGDLFAITVDNTNADQGLWQDACNATGNSCATPTVNFATRIPDAVIDTTEGVIQQGDYNLSLAAVPVPGDTLLFVGTRDIFRCSLTDGCELHNTTNVDGDAAVQVAPSQHAIDATYAASGVIYFGNDGGLWRTTSLAPLYQNLNSGIGSLAEVTDFSQHPQNEDILMATMGIFGTAATQTASGAWAQVLDTADGGNAIDSANPQNWFAGSADPFAIHLCASGPSCDQTAFGPPVISSTQIGDDGGGPWILDPQNPANLILGTCRLWRGPAANGSAWNVNSIISPILDGVPNISCNGNARIRSLAASGSPNDPAGAPEKIYAGMAGVFDGGGRVAGHIYSGSVGGASGVMPVWVDLTNSPVINSGAAFNAAGFDISSIYVDPHDPSGNTVYVTIQGFVPSGGSEVYRSVDGGAHWIVIGAGLPDAPANSILVDPGNANIVYVALDTGVYVTQNINQCTDTALCVWNALGNNLPEAPVTQLRAFDDPSNPMLRAATYGRGIWQIPLLTAAIPQTTASLSPPSLTFSSQPVNTLSSAQTIVLTNTGSVPLTITGIAVDTYFAQQNNCGQAVPAGASCNIQVSFAPTTTGTLQGTLTIYGNLPAGQVTAALAGVGAAPGDVVLMPGSIDFGTALIGVSTAAQNITISNTGSTTIHLQSPSVTGDFLIGPNTCGTALPPDTGCTVAVKFAPTQSGSRSGIFSIRDDDGTQTVPLTGTGQSPATAVLSASSLNFSQPQTVGTRSAPQQLLLTNDGDASLSDISIGIDGDFTAQNNCGAFLAGHTSCAVSVVFVPTRVGPESGLLTVSTISGAHTVALNGTGQAPGGVSLLPNVLDFGSQGANTTSAPQQVVLTNSSAAPLTNLSFTAGGDFALANGGTCASGGTLNAQSSCSLYLTFTPSQTGARSGSLTVNATGHGSPLNVLLSGIGEDFQLNITGSSSTVITAGQTATFNLQVQPATGSSGTLSLACSGAPATATCSINPGTLPLQSGVTGFATITIATTNSNAGASFAGKAGAVFAAILLPCMFLRRRRLWIICLCALSLLLPAACGVHATGGGKTSPSQPSGSTEVYNLAITASVPGMQKTVPITLTVQQ